ncbi:MAG: lipopolysaccharide kinase InaA family protein, partial [Desulfohalobiaceae bacterium]
VSGVLNAHRKAVAADSPDVLKRSHRSTVSRQKIAAPPGGIGVVVKENLCPGVRDCLKNLLRRPRGVAAWAHGNALLVRKVDVARPLAAVVERGGLLRRRSWLVMEEPSGFERLDLLVRARYSGRCSRERHEEKLRLVQGCGVFLGRLHGQGVYHGDMKAMNIMARFAANGEPQFRLIDYDRVRFFRQVDRRRRIKNLAQLASSIPDQVSRADRLRFFQAYAFDDDARQNLREYNQGVAALCRNRGKPAREVRS